MALFNRRPRLPKNLVSMMMDFGRIEWKKVSRGRTRAVIEVPPVDSAEVWSLYISPFLQLARADEGGLLTELARAVVPVGGWSAYGAERLLMEVLSRPPQDNSAFDAIMRAAVTFLRESGVPPMFVSGHEWNYWLSTGGDNRTWLTMLSAPSVEEAPIDPLPAGQVRKVAQLDSNDYSNLIYVRADAPDSYVWVSEARYSDEDPTRSQWDSETASTLYDLYLRIGYAMQIPTYWYDPQLKPFFPLPDPLI